MGGHSFAQQPVSNLRTRYVATTQSPVQLDFLSIIPGTVSIEDVSGEYYEVDEMNALLFWKKKVFADSVLVAWRVFPYKLNAEKFRFRFDSIRYNFAAENPQIFQGNVSQKKLFDFENLNYNGSFGRGISFGNNQDAVVNSTLNLQLNGYIGDSMEISAAVSDQNIPVQPEGNTQRLNEFDRIFMQIRKNDWKAEFGDIDIRQEPGYFMRFYKRLQGAAFYSKNKIGTKADNSILMSGAIAKGKFARNVIPVAEGNQGPYKLYTPSNDLYFAVLAGTERVFLDGKLLNRGDDKDYIIDYNTAELTFTVHQPVTRESRVQVEFEYSDRNFLNSLLYGSNTISINRRFAFNISAYSNADAKHSPINQTLNTEQKQFLASIGNDIDQAFFASSYKDSFSLENILYAKRDTTYNGIHDSVYVYSTDSSSVLYTVSFTNMGQGKGNYIPSSSHANGRVFEWIMPVNGIPQGSWEPVLLLITPKSYQLMSLSSEYSFSEKSSVRAEVAVSDYDVNTFSSIGNRENKGLAGKLTYSILKEVLPSLNKNLVLEAKASYEVTQQSFKTVETLRNVEFYRDWGLPLLALPEDEHLAEANIHFFNPENNFLNYSFQTLQRKNGYSGFKNSIESDLHFKQWNWKNRIYLTTNNSDFQKGQFFRPSSELSRTFDHFLLGAAFSMEDNQQMDKAHDSLLPLSMGFHQMQFYIRSPITKTNKWGVGFSHRENKLPSRNELLKSDRSRNVNAFLTLLESDEHQLKLNAVYRNIKVEKKMAINEKDDESLLGRMEYDITKWNGFLTGNFLYETGAGQEQKREYTYVEVPAGQGFYTWNDYNKDGIPQQDEFEIAVFEDQKRWVKIFTPTNEYVKANYVQLNYHIGLRPSALLDGSALSNFTKFMRRFGAASSLQVNKKSVFSKGFLFNPFNKNLADTSLILLQSLFSNTVFFNRSSTIWGIDFTQRSMQNKALLNYGFESNSRTEFSTKARWNITRKISTTFNNSLIKNSMETPGLANRNYSITEMVMEPAAAYIYKTDLRVSLIYMYSEKRNKIRMREEAVKHAVTAEVKYNVLSSGTFSGRFSYNQIRFLGQPNSTTGYILLDGLLPGKNLLWNLDFTKRIAGNIEMNLQYDARKAGETKVVHTGRAGLRAIL